MSAGLFSSAIAGVLVSFSGSLPLGNLNLSAMYIAAERGRTRAVPFAVGAVGIEMLYLAFTLLAVQWVVRHPGLFHALQWIAVAVLLALAVSSFLAARSPAGKGNVLINNRLPAWTSGMVMSALNPLQIPFWAGWAVALHAQGWLSLHAGSAAFFLLGAGVGTFLAFALFINLGNWLSSRLRRHHAAVQYGLSVLFILMAAYQWVLIMKH